MIIIIAFDITGSTVESFVRDLLQKSNVCVCLIFWIIIQEEIGSLIEAMRNK